MFAIGTVEAIFRYPVKSMRGEQVQTAELGWHGLAGDRRLAFQKVGDRGGFPWLTASKVAELLLYTPFSVGGESTGLPTHVRTPDGAEFPLYSEELAADVGRRFGSPVEMIHIRNGIFDEGSISVITSGTVVEIGQLAEQTPDVRRFRPNIVVRGIEPAPFLEEQWVNRALSFGEGLAAPTVRITMRDTRCSMINLDPDSAKPTPAVLKAVARANATNAGVYATVTNTGMITVGQTVYLDAER